jgi:hypothetical protein
MHAEHPYEAGSHDCPLSPSWGKLSKSTKLDAVPGSQRSRNNRGRADSPNCAVPSLGYRRIPDISILCCATVLEVLETVEVGVGCSAKGGWRDHHPVAQCGVR